MPSPNFPFAPGLTIPNTPAAPSVGPTDLLWIWQNGQLLRATFSQVSALVGGTPGGTTGQIQYNNSGNLAGFTLGGDATVNTGTGILTVANNAISNAKFRQSTALSIVGNAGTATANVADIAGTANQVLAVNSAGTALAFGAVNLASAAAVTGLLGGANGGTGANNGSKTFTFSNSLTLSGTDGTAFAFPAVSDTVGCLGTGQTWTKQNLFSLANAASTPPIALTGAWFSGGTSTTTKPQLLVEPSGTTTAGWNTNGTGIGVNAPSGFAGYLLDCELNGSTQFAVRNDGLVFWGALNSFLDQHGGISIGGGTTLAFNGATTMATPNLLNLGGSADTGISRTGAAAIAFGNGTVNDASAACAMGSLRVNQAPTANTSASTTITNSADSSTNLGHRASFNMNGTIFWFPCGATAF